MTQIDRVYQHMAKYGSITQREADDNYGCTDVAGVVYKLKKRGHAIIAKWEDGTNKFGDPTHFKRYYLVLEEEGDEQ